MAIDSRKMKTQAPNIRLSGHETFVCRYAWLPKVVQHLNSNPDLFKNEDAAMVVLGVGKNMVRSMRYWAEATQVIEQTKRGTYAVASFGQQLLGHDGHDPFLEDPKTLWLLHWKLATNTAPPLFIWQQMLNYWHRAEFSVSEVIPSLERGLPANAKKRSTRTLSDGFRVFVNSYVPTRGRKGEVGEDNLDCPLVELDLIRAVGERNTTDQSGRELIYAFAIEDKPDISPALFTYCLNEYWQTSSHSGQTLAFRFISSDTGSPGQIFKLPELAVRNLLEQLSASTDKALEFLESNSIQQVVRNRDLQQDDLLDAIYPSK